MEIIKVALCLQENAQFILFKLRIQINISPNTLVDFN